MEGTFILVILHVSTKQSMLLSEIDKKTIKNLNRAICMETLKKECISHMKKRVFSWVKNIVVECCEVIEVKHGRRGNQKNTPLDKVFSGHKIHGIHDYLFHAIATDYNPQHHRGITKT